MNCKQCGASYSKSKEFCPYCKAANPNFETEEEKKAKEENEEKDSERVVVNNTINNNIPTNSNNSFSILSIIVFIAIAVITYFVVSKILK